MRRDERRAMKALAALCLIRALLLYAPAFAAPAPTWYLDAPRGVDAANLWCEDSQDYLVVLTIVRRSMVNTDDPASLVCRGAGHRYVASNVDGRSQVITLSLADYRVNIPIIMSAMPY